MAGITFTVEFDDEAAARRLAEIVERMDRPIGFYKAAGDYVRDVVVRRSFQTESAPDGTPWAQLSPVTLAQRQKNGRSGTKILYDTGHFQGNTISSEAFADHARIGSSAVQAAVLQFGAAKGSFGAAIGRTKASEKRPWSQDYFATLPWGDIPARPWLGLSSEDEMEIIRIASDWLEAE